MTPAAISLAQLNARVAATVAAGEGLRGVWVVAETSDLRVSGGHCYMELIDKDPDTGKAVARLRATVWASRWAAVNSAFRAATGVSLGSDMKVMLCVSVAFHPLYGLSATVTDINPEYTLGDLLRRRREMVERLRAEGIIDLNRSLEWPEVPWRVAVISSAGAAGYGDFINQLYNNRYRLRFTTRLFPAVLQGESTAPSIIAALEDVAADGDEWDCVVIIRGGGATGDLASFDDYALAANIAMFPLPVVIGIGHERDVTLLDYVANMRVKTPTAAAEWLIDRGEQALDRLRTLGADILAAATAATATARRRLDYMSGQLPLLAQGAIERQKTRTGEAVTAELETSLRNITMRRSERLQALATLLETLSPEATLRRGFSISRVDGHAITSAAEAPPGAVIVTTLADGTVTSTVNL